MYTKLFGIVNVDFDVISYWSDILYSSDTGESGGVMGQYSSYL
jgi:hypothetical protein